MKRIDCTKKAGKKPLQKVCLKATYFLSIEVDANMNICHPYFFRELRPHAPATKIFCVYSQGQHLQQLRDYLEVQELEKQDHQFQVQQEVNETLSHQASQRKNNALGKGEPLNLEMCSSSSLQRFYGEDNDFSERKKMQQHQLRQWCSQGFLERSSKQNDEKETENEYAKYILEEDRVRCEVALEEQKQRRESEISVMHENKRLAEERRRKQHQQIKDDNDKKVATSPFFCEDTEHLRSTFSDNRVRPDHFKGLSSDQLQSIINDNETLVKERKKKLEEEMQIEHDWEELLTAQMGQMEEQEQHKLKIREEDNKVQVETLKMQQEEMIKKQQQMEKDRFGGIEYGFFQKFGASCR